ncbi:hypothetical protein BDR26DRAFT_855377 [Obelidium mucronatum]|nr:hypothetical protein BDR26DRAFT_855377 [Obelidium mucronatum]
MLSSNSKPTQPQPMTSSSLDAAMQIRLNAEETQRQMKDLLAWEKSVKASTVKTGTSAKQTPPHNDGRNTAQRIKSFDYKAWDKFDVENEINKIEQVEQQSANEASSAVLSTGRANESTTESPQQLEQRLENSLLEKEKGNAYFKKGDYSKAARCYSKSLKLNPDNALVLGNRAMTFLKLNDFKAAEADCTAVLVLEPKNVKALWRRGVSRREIGVDLKGAKTDLEQALVLEPTNVSVKQELAKVQASIAEVADKQKSNTSKPLRRRVEIAEVGDAKAFKGEETPLLAERSTERKNQPSTTSTTTILDLPTAKASVPNPSAEPPTTKPKVSDVRTSGLGPQQLQPKKKESILQIVADHESPTPISQATVLNPPSPKTTKRPLIVDLDEVTPAQQPKETVPEPLSPKKPAPAVVALPPKLQSTTAQAPTTMYAFELEWKNRKNDLEALYLLLKSMDPKSYRFVFKNSLESHYLSTIFEILKEFYTMHESFDCLYNTLDGLTVVDRFSMNVKFCNSKDKAALKQIFAHLEDSIGESETGKDATSLKELERKFGVKR